MPRLGILDWGIGGLGLYQLIKRDYPALPITYWSDAGFTPYGKVPPPALAARVHHIAQHLGAEGVTHLAIACNAASTVLPLAHPLAHNSPIHNVRFSDKEFPVLEISGVLEHGARAAAAQPSRYVIGIVGGRRTIRSLAYRRLLPRRNVLQRVAQPISAFIEAGQLHGPSIEAALDAIMQPLANVDVLVLACTHYPAILAQWQQRAPHATIIDPAAHMWQWMQRAWPITAMAQASRNKLATRDLFFTTGSAAAMKKSARQAFGVGLADIRNIKL